MKLEIIYSSSPRYLLKILFITNFSHLRYDPKKYPLL